tara:strand:- start:436 stop:678 length:243 start_codon:yes stop_codon:yes gene_type:complete
MTHDQILEALNKVFCNIFDDKDMVLDRETTANDIEEWDSLNQIKIILACEEAFNLRLKPREISALDNIGGMVDHLSKLLR